MKKNFIGLFSFAKREIIRFLIVSQQTVLPPLVTSTLFIFIFGLSVGKNISWAASDFSYLGFIIPGLVTMHIVSSSFENTSSSLFISRWHNHIQEILLSPLSYFEMVLGLLVGGWTRAIITGLGVYGIACIFEYHPIAHPWWLLFFLFCIPVIFSCAGMMAALWADNFGMLSVWNIYVITPLTFLGGVFNPISMLPDPIQAIAVLNPMYHLVNGMRYGMIGVAEAPIEISAVVTLFFVVTSFSLCVHLFKIGYKLRT